MSTSIFPEELTSLDQWTLHVNKRPVIPPDKANEAQEYRVVSQHNDIGIILSHTTEAACIDVDFPGSKEEKKAVIKLAKECGFTQEDWTTPRYAAWLKENTRLFQQLEGTGLEELLTTTYCEFSPSGIGIHIWLNVHNKSRTKAAYKKSTNPALHGQLSLQNCFMTVTRRPLYGAKPTLARLSVDFAPQAFKFQKTTSSSEKSKTRLRNDSSALAEFVQLSEELSVTESQITDALTLVPCIPAPKVQKQWQELTGKAYEHYDFWLTIGMALHDYGKRTENLVQMFIAWLNWSKKDTANFEGEDSLETKWRSFGNSQASVTVATLLAMAARMKFEYPRPIYDKDGKRTVMPQVNEYVNFAYLMKYYNIVLWEDDLYYVSGDEETMRTYFSRCGTPVLGKFYGPYTKTELEAFTLVLCQDSHWRKLTSTATLVQTWIATSAYQFDLFQCWLDTPYDELDDSMKQIYAGNESYSAHHFDHNSTIEYLFDCLNAQYKNQKERELYYSMFKKILMQMIKFREPDVLKLPFVDNGGMLILAGVENTYKSTFVKLLVPRQLDVVRKEVNSPIQGEKNIRDFLRYFANKSIIQVDEFESVMDINSSFFKNLLSSNDPSFVDIYASQERKKLRKAIVIGTTNKTRMVLSEDGTRRLWFIPVGKIDTDAALRVNLHKLYNDLREEFREEFSNNCMPWLLTQPEIDQLNSMNQAFAAQSDLDLVLEELWPIGSSTMPEGYLDGVDVSRDKGPKTLSSSQVRAVLMMNGHPNLKPTVVEHALKRFCTKWTGLKAGQTVRVKSRVVQDGKIHQNWNEERQRYTYSRWVMPVRAEDE